MNTLKNKVLIDAPIEKIWDSLAITDKLDTYDPTVKKSTSTSDIKSGIGASRKVDMLDGKTGLKRNVQPMSRTKHSSTL